MPKSKAKAQRWAIPFAVFPLVVLGIIFFGGLLIFILNVTASPNSPAKSVVMLRRDADITIQTSGDARVIETWQTQFIGGPFHTAFRIIPIDRVEAISDWSIGGDGTNLTTSYFSNTNGQRATWTFAETTDQTRTFILSYTLHGALRIYPNGDQFWWKMIEPDRAYPINASRVTLHLPANIPIDQLKATTYLNINDSGNARIIDGQTIEFIGGPFAEGNFWEVRVQFPHGIVSATVPVWQARAEEEERYAETLRVVGLAQIFGAVILLVGGIASALGLWYIRLRVRPAGIIAEYLSAPPSTLSPAAADTLLNGESAPRDVMATLVDLARRGFVKISSSGSNQHTFDQVKSPRAKSVTLFEAALLDAFFGDQPQRTSSTLPHHFDDKLPRLYKQIQDEILQDGYILATTNTRGGLFSTISNIVFWGGGALAVAGWYFTSDVTLGIVDCVAVLIVTWIFGRLSQTKMMRTAQGATETAKWRAFKRYLEHIEKYTQLKSAHDQFDKYLAYAIAFGLEKDWVAKFSAVDTPAPTWYHETDEPKHHRNNDDDEQDDRSNRASSPSSKRAPSLDGMASRSFSSLDSMSASLFGMLNSTTDRLSSSGESSSSHSSSSSSSWSGGSSGSSSGGGGGGGGSSGFG